MSAFDPKRTLAAKAQPVPPANLSSQPPRQAHQLSKDRRDLRTPPYWWLSKLDLGDELPFGRITGNAKFAVLVLCRSETVMMATGLKKRKDAKQ
jgi:hypothetical protein